MALAVTDVPAVSVAGSPLARFAAIACETGVMLTIEEFGANA